MAEQGANGTTGDWDADSAIWQKVSEIDPEWFRGQVEAARASRKEQLAVDMERAMLSERGANSRNRASIAGANRNASLAASTARQNAKLAAETQRYGIDVGRLTDQEKIALDREMGQTRAGIDVLGLGAQLTGPARALDYVDMLLGAPALNAGGFLGALFGNRQLVMEGTAGAKPQPMNLATLANDLGYPGGGGVTSDGGAAMAGGTGVGGTPAANVLAAIGGTAAGNPQGYAQQMKAFQGQVGDYLSKAGGLGGLQPGQFQRLSPSAQSLFLNAAGKEGWDPRDLIDQTYRFGVGQ